MIEQKLERFSNYTFTRPQTRRSAAIMRHTSLATPGSESQSRIDDEQQAEEDIVT
jgi:hypothetical protein